MTHKPYTPEQIESLRDLCKRNTIADALYGPFLATIDAIQGELRGVWEDAKLAASLAIERRPA